MRRLQICMWHQLSRKKWEAEGSELITGLEISQFENQEALVQAKEFCEVQGMAFGLHSPALKQGAYALPQLTSLDEREREQAFASFEQDVQTAAAAGADYLLVHYPFLPVVPGNPLVWYDRLPGPEMRIDADQMSRQTFHERSKELFERLSILQNRYGQRLLLEHDFFGDYTEDFTAMFRMHPDIQLVVDTARLDITARITAEFDPYKWLDELAPHVYLVHYSNVRYSPAACTHHLPALSEQENHPDFGDAWHYLKFLAARNTRFHLTFEHHADLINREQLMNLYEEVFELLGKQRSVKAP